MTYYNLIIKHIGQKKQDWIIQVIVTILLQCYYYVIIIPIFGKSLYQTLD